MKKREHHYNEWFWLRDEIAGYVNNHPAGTVYTEAELRAAIKRTQWGRGASALPVTQESIDAAYSSMFVPVAEEKKPVLMVIDSLITRTDQRPTYSD